MSAILEFIKTTATQAGAIALADQAVLKAENIHAKGSVLDLVTDTDRKVEQFIVSKIRKFMPEAGVFGEEGGKDHADREYCFVIDPIDGTASFVHNLPNWCISIGLWHNKIPVAGAIFQPSAGDLYYAEAGQGAFLNGLAIRVSGREKLEESIVSTGFYCLRAGWKEENNLKFLCRIAPLVADQRKYGSAALDCCLVARGSTAAFWELFLQPYDVGAGIIIAKEAGATITDLKGGEAYPGNGFLCTNGKLHSTMLSFFTDFQALHR